MTTTVRGYVLAGGRSSRMGVDKAEMRLGGQTLLEIAVGKLERVCGEVVVVGQREVLPKGVRSVVDRWTGCGPLGGMESALSDLSETATEGGGDRSALFLPVDMPMIPVPLLEGLARLWGESGSRACFLVADGREQPLLSLLGRGLLPEVQAALGRGDYRVRRVLEDAGRGVGPGETGDGDSAGEAVLRTEIWTSVRESVWPGWLPSEAEWAARELWFANLNTPEEFALAERFAGTLISA